jgi:hypothetical protein
MPSRLSICFSLAQGSDKILDKKESKGLVFSCKQEQF